MCAKSQLLDFLCPLDFKGWVISMIDFYLDDTGDEPTFVGFGGFAGKREAWEEAQEALLVTNQEQGISWFHAKNYSNLIPEYTDFILKRKLYFLGRTFDLKTYREYTNKTVRDSFGINEWASCAASMFKLCADFMLQNPNDEAVIVLDCRGHYRQSIQDVWDELPKYAENSQQLVLLTLVSKEVQREKFPLLQIADLGANILCKHARVTHYDSIEEDPIPRFQEKHLCFGVNHLSASRACSH
jgi:Protein of unknown function (DUF3800)